MVRAGMQQHANDRALKLGCMAQEARTFVAACLQKDPGTRPTAAELLAHPFLQKAKSCDYTCRRLLGQKPAPRPILTPSGSGRKTIFK